MPYAPRKRDALLQAIIDRVGYTRLGRRLDPPLSKQAIYAWRQVPEDRIAQVVKIAKALKLPGASPYGLRPDLFHRNGKRIDEANTLIVNNHATKGRS